MAVLVEAISLVVRRDSIDRSDRLSVAVARPNVIANKFFPFPVTHILTTRPVGSKYVIVQDN
jgi:hypothetical protein